MTDNQIFHTVVLAIALNTKQVKDCGWSGVKHTFCKKAVLQHCCRNCESVGVLQRKISPVRDGTTDITTLGSCSKSMVPNLRWIHGPKMVCDENIRAWSFLKIGTINMAIPILYYHHSGYHKEKESCIFNTTKYLMEYLYLSGAQLLSHLTNNTFFKTTYRELILLLQTQPWMKSTGKPSDVCSLLSFSKSVIWICPITHQ